MSSFQRYKVCMNRSSDERVMAPGSRGIGAVFVHFSGEDSDQTGDAFGEPRVPRRSWSRYLSNAPGLVDQLVASRKDSAREGGYFDVLGTVGKLALPTFARFRVCGNPSLDFFDHNSLVSRPFSTRKVRNRSSRYVLYTNGQGVLSKLLEMYPGLHFKGFWVWWGPSRAWIRVAPPCVPAPEKIPWSFLVGLSIVLQIVGLLGQTFDSHLDDGGMVFDLSHNFSSHGKISPVWDALIRRMRLQTLKSLFLGPKAMVQSGRCPYKM
uniref:Uncharacterized protein n=1 Tax=Fagus sylvatica TaxID=28930 RepID=A0A2N9ISK4_FAGSY